MTSCPLCIHALHVMSLATDGFASGAGEPRPSFVHKLLLNGASGTSLPSGTGAADPLQFLSVVDAKVRARDAAHARAAPLSSVQRSPGLSRAGRARSRTFGGSRCALRACSPRSIPTNDTYPSRLGAPRAGPCFFATRAWRWNLIERFSHVFKRHRGCMF